MVTGYELQLKDEEFRVLRVGDTVKQVQNAKCKM
jgi:hypothetical protein